MSICKQLDIDGKDIVFTSDLYMTDKDSYLDWIYATDDSIDTLMIV